MGRLAWLGSLILLPAAGAPLLLRGAFRRFPPAARVILSAGAGAALVSFALTLFSLAGVAWRVAPAFAAAALLAACLSPLAGAAASRPSAERLGPPGMLAASLSAACVVAALAAALTGAATSIDLFFFWGPKAQQFALARGVGQQRATGRERARRAAIQERARTREAVLPREAAAQRERRQERCAGQRNENGRGLRATGEQVSEL